VAIANMVLALKEIQIRGDIRTNVDYTIDLLHVCFLLPTYKSYTVTVMYPDKIISLINQASDYRENKIHTGWLDSRIAMRVRAERPPWYLSVVGGALYVRPSFSELCLS